MKHSLLFLLFVIPQFILASNSKIDVYISSRDCFKCISQTKEIVRKINQEEYDLNIFVEFKSKRSQVLASMGEIVSIDDLIVNRDEVLKRTEDGNSVIEISCDNLEYSSLLNDFDVKDLNNLCANDNSYSRRSVPDTLFEDGNFKVFVDIDNYYFLHNDFDILKIVNLSNNQAPKNNDIDIAITEDEYNSYVKQYAKDLGKKVLYYKSAVVNAKNNFLPIQNNKSIFAKGNKIIILQNINFFIHDKEGEYMFKGKNFIAVGDLNIMNNRIDFNRNLVEIDTTSSYLSSITMDVPHMNLNGSKYFAPVRLYNNNDRDKLMNDNAIGVHYEINSDNTLVYGKREFINNFNVDTTTQKNLRKYLYGGSDFNLVGENLYLTYSPLETIVDISNAKSYTIGDFLEDNYGSQSLSEEVNTIGIDLSEHKFSQGYILNKQFFVRNFGKYTSQKIKKCDFPANEKGNIYYFGGNLYKIFKDDQYNVLHLSKCSCETSISAS